MTSARFTRPRLISDRGHYPYRPRPRNAPDVSHAFHDNDVCIKCRHTLALHFHDDAGYYCISCSKPHGEYGPIYDCVELTVA